MGSIDKWQCGCVSATGLERVRYFPRQLLTADDLRLDQDYFREKQRRHNRFLHGWGVVCGLKVLRDLNAGPLAITVCPGFALGPCGDEIYVGDPVGYDLAPIVQQRAQSSCTSTSASAAALTSGPLTVMIRYRECQTRPVRTPPIGCGCDESACEFTRIRDGFEICAIAKENETASPAPPSLCEIENDIEGKFPPMPPTPLTDWVQLATITLNGTTTLTQQMIDNDKRKVLFSTTQIQYQVAAGCTSTTAAVTRSKASLAEGWSNSTRNLFGGTTGPASYYQNSAGVLYLEGMVQHAKEGNEETIFTLPDGLRPTSLMFFQVVGGAIIITPAGEVIAKGEDGSNLGTEPIALEGVAFHP